MTTERERFDAHFSRLALAREVNDFQSAWIGWRERAPSVPADAAAQEWAAAVRLTFATARSLPSLQGVPSHWLEAMRDAALGVTLPDGGRKP